MKNKDLQIIGGIILLYILFKKFVSSDKKENINTGTTIPGPTVPIITVPVEEVPEIKTDLLLYKASFVFYTYPNLYNLIILPYDKNSYTALQVYIGIETENTTNNNIEINNVKADVLYKSENGKYSKVGSINQQTHNLTKSKAFDNNPLMVKSKTISSLILTFVPTLSSPFMEFLNTNKGHIDLQINGTITQTINNKTYNFDFIVYTKDVKYYGEFIDFNFFI